jgi:circadian clock protein KaiC
MDATIKHLSTGITGLDEILKGGYEAGCSHLIRGRAGAGKTILGFHFLAAGVAENEQVLFISLQESEIQLRARAARIGLNMSKVHVLDLSPPMEFFAQAGGYDIFSPAEVERRPISRLVIDTIETLKPTRIFIDPISHFRFLAIDQFHFRKQILSFLKYLSIKQATVLATSETSDDTGDADLQSMVDSIYRLEHESINRTLIVQKVRGSGFMEGFHAIKITSKGMEVIPNKLPAFHKPYTRDTLSSGVPQIDELLYGGIERGTVTLVSGPSGVGKTTLCMQFMKEAASRGERSVVFACEEASEMMIQQCDSVDMPTGTMIENGMLGIYRVDPSLVLCNELQNFIRVEVEKKGAMMFMLDSVTSYARCLPDSITLFRNLEMISTYLEGFGGTLFITSETFSIIECTSISELGLSGIADTIIFMRYMETHGGIRKAIGVLKKRLSDFEKNLREFEITKYGIKVGQPLKGLRGILKGIPEEIG